MESLDGRRPVLTRNRQGFMVLGWTVGGFPNHIGVTAPNNFGPGGVWLCSVCHHTEHYVENPPAFALEHAHGRMDEEQKVELTQAMFDLWTEEEKERDEQD